MLYLARVQRKLLFGQMELQLLSQQTGDGLWLPIRNADPLLSSEAQGFNVGVLVMVELQEGQQILKLEEASGPLTEILYRLSQPSSSEYDLSEIERWRQSLTQQSQALSRREAEIEARQEQLQHWEKVLKRREASS